MNSETPNITQTLLLTAFKKTIRHLIEDGFGVYHSGANTRALDLRGFALSSIPSEFNHELLMPNSERIAFLDEDHAYSEDGLIANTNWVIGSQLEQLEYIFDTLHALKEKPCCYQVILRAVITSEDEEFIHSSRLYPQPWVEYDRKTTDGQLSIRLDTTVTVTTVSGASIDDAIEAAISDAPSLGLEEFNDEHVQVEFWVDKNQPDIILVRPHTLTSSQLLHCP